eukprot:scaffold2098_cov120-Isochrysis_galbana.AAC.3
MQERRGCDCVARALSAKTHAHAHMPQLQRGPRSSSFLSSSSFSLQYAVLFLGKGSPRKKNLKKKALHTSGDSAGHPVPDDPSALSRSPPLTSRGSPRSWCIDPVGAN